MVNRMILFTVATIVGMCAVLVSTLPVAAQGAGLYFWKGTTSQGEELDLYVSAGPVDNSWTVTGVRLAGAAVRCANSTEYLELGELVFPANALIKTAPAAPFSIAGLVSDDEQVALLIKSQAVGETQIKATVYVFWSHLHYSGAKETMPVSERCYAALTVTIPLQLWVLN